MVKGFELQRSLQIKFYFYCYNLFKGEQKIREIKDLTNLFQQTLTKLEMVQ